MSVNVNSKGISHIEIPVEDRYSVDVHFSSNRFSIFHFIEEDRRRFGPREKAVFHPQGNLTQKYTPGYGVIEKAWGKMLEEPHVQKLVVVAPYIEDPKLDEGFLDE